MRNNPLSLKGRFPSCWTTQTSRLERVHGVPAEPAHFTSGHAGHVANLKSPGPLLFTVSGAVNYATAIGETRVTGPWDFRARRPSAFGIGRLQCKSTTLPIELISDQRDMSVAGYKNAQIPSLERKPGKRRITSLKLCNMKLDYTSRLMGVNTCAGTC